MCVYVNGAVNGVGRAVAIGRFRVHRMYGRLATSDSDRLKLTTGNGCPRHASIRKASSSFELTRGPVRLAQNASRSLIINYITLNSELQTLLKQPAQRDVV